MHPFFEADVMLITANKPGSIQCLGYIHWKPEELDVTSQCPRNRSIHNVCYLAKSAVNQVQSEKFRRKTLSLNNHVPVSTLSENIGISVSASLTSWPWNLYASTCYQCCLTSQKIMSVIYTHIEGKLDFKPIFNTYINH